MHIFDYSFLDEGLLPAEIVNLTATITAFNAIADTRKESNKSIYTVSYTHLDVYKRQVSDTVVSSYSRAEIPVSWHFQALCPLF